MEKLSQRQPTGPGRTRRAGRRLGGAFAVAVVLSVLSAPAASAQLTVVKDLTHQLGDTVTETGGKAGDLVTGSGGKVGDTLGGPVGGAVKKATGQVGGTVTGTSATVGSTVTSVGEAADRLVGDTLETVDGVTGGVTNRQGDGGGSGKKGNGSEGAVPDLAERAASSTPEARTPFPLVGSKARFIAATEGTAHAAGWSYLDARTPAQLFGTAVEAAKRFAFPLALTLLVMAFLLIQNRIDSKDPKLALAALDKDGELLSFS